MNYCAKGITVNGVAPALIQDTSMLPGSNDELVKSELRLSFVLQPLFLFRCFESALNFIIQMSFLYEIIIFHGLMPCTQKSLLVD